LQYITNSCCGTFVHFSSLFPPHFSSTSVDSTNLMQPPCQIPPLTAFPPSQLSSTSLDNTNALMQPPCLIPPFTAFLPSQLSSTSPDSTNELMQLQQDLEKEVAAFEGIMEQHALDTRVRQWLRASAYASYELLAVCRDEQEGSRGQVGGAFWLLDGNT
jgi:hypothetical protein